MPMRTISISLGFSFFASLYGAQRPGTVWGTCLAHIAEQMADLGGGGAVRGWVGPSCVGAGLSVGGGGAVRGWWRLRTPPPSPAETLRVLPTTPFALRSSALIHSCHAEPALASAVTYVPGRGAFI